ncbi:GNAT family N-acetyltransferase [Nocardioides xinjiangensis]|uniref:GNAT family N-acetyltransferase n=1 Tax=Nocardioides xinjiangensis TaxID=2817376 RepID=UPI001B314BF5|nr:GNAT family N-acetyltransferase [Nocardioides sp. SYSU D00514]
MTQPSVRHVQPGDVPALTAIRAHYVLHTHSTFDVVPPTEDEVRAWTERFSEDTAHQLLVAVEAGDVIGYAATLRYRPRPAFDATVEMSVYLDPERRARGAGSALYQELLARSARHGTRTFLAGVALPNEALVAFHRKHGFREVGTFVDHARKWDRDISSTWFQRRASAPDERA